MASFRLCCIACGARYADAPRRLVCDRCIGRQLPGGPVEGILEVELDALPRRWPDADVTDPRFLEAFLPAPAAYLEALTVGGTPLIAPDRLRATLGMPRLTLKDDRRNPSGSTKDRASLLVCAKAREHGFDTVATASTGNAAIALAALAAAHGLEAVVLVPGTAPRGKLALLRGYGATVLAVRGSYDQAFELASAACARFGWYNRNTALNPFTIEGKKTAALEIARAMAPEVPDAVLVPTGDGVILSGLAKGFADLKRSGLTARLPRLIAVQPEGSAAIVRAIEADADGIEPVEDAASIADSLVVEAPRGAIACLRAIRGSGGTAVAVSERAIEDAVATLAKRAGILAEPAAAASLAGLLAARERGLVASDERVVLMVTGAARDAGALPAGAEPVTLPPDLDAVAEHLAARA